MGGGYRNAGLWSAVQGDASPRGAAPGLAVPPDSSFYSRLLAVSLAVLFLRGGVLALFLSWGLPAQ